MAANEGVKTDNVLKYIVKEHAELKGLLAIFIIAIAMSTADSYINTASVLFVNDIVPSIKKIKNPLLVARLSNVITGILSLSLVLITINKSLLQLVFLSSTIYLPVVVMPLLLAILGFRTTTRMVVCSMLIGLVTSILLTSLCDSSFGIVAGMFANVTTLLSGHYLLKEPGGWVGIQEKAPLVAAKQQSRRRHNRFRAAIKKFSLQKYLPKGEHVYMLLGAYVLTFVFGSCFFLRNLRQGSFLSFVSISVLVVNSLLMTYPIWPAEVKSKRVIAPLWSFTVFYILFYASSLLVFLSGFQFVHVMLFAINLMVTVLLLRWKFTTCLFGLGALLGALTYRSLGFSFFLTTTVITPAALIFISFIVLSAVLVLNRSRQRSFQLEQRQIILQELKKAAEETLDQLKSAPDYFVKQVAQTNSAGIQSAHVLSQELQNIVRDTKSIQKAKEVIAGKTLELTEQIGKSAQYLEKTINLIETQTQLQKSTIGLQKFLNRLYDDLPDDGEGALLLDHQAKAKTIQCDVLRVHQLLRKTYEQIRLQKPEHDYFYLHVQDTALRYPNHTKPIAALAFLFTDSEQTNPNIAASYTHLDKMPIDPHLAGNRFLKEAQVMVDKHYGYLGLSNMPNEYLIVLPTRLDDIRPKIIEDEQAPNRSLNNELLREAKEIELSFWHAIIQQPHYNILEIEGVVNFMKATHQHQTRKSGHPYYMHTLSVAKYASEHSKESYIVIAALLHDIVEDTGMGLEEIGVRFGPKVEKLVKLLSNIKGAFKKYKLDSKKDQVALLASDKEAILIKACDRLHNLQTLGAMPRHKQKAKAEETLKHYTPVIRAAGFEKLADQLEETARKFL